MVDKTPGDRKLSVPNKTLTLKPRVETGTVRQSFSHGRTKQVVVEKRGKRRVGGDAPATETHAPEPAAVAKAARCPPQRLPPRRRSPVPQRRRRLPSRSDSGVVLRTLTEDERSARASALADAKVRDMEERRLAEEEAKRRNSKEGIEQAEREAAEARRKAEEERHRQDEEAKRKAELEAKKRFGEAEAKTAAAARAALPAARAPGIAADITDEDEGPRQVRRGPGGAVRPATAPKTTAKPAPAEAARPPDAGHRAQCRRRARALDRLVPPPHPAPEGTCVERAEGKAGSRSGDSGSHQYPGTRQPHVRARGRRHPPADEAGRDAQDHRRDRCRHRAADRRGTGPHRQARRRLRRRGRPVRHRRRFHRYRAAFAGGDRDGPCRPRQDLAARRASPRQCGVRRGRRHHPAYRRLSGDLAGKRQEDHLHRHPRPRRVHRDARPRRQGDRHRDPGGRGR